MPFGVAAKVEKYAPVLLNAVFEGAKKVYGHVVVVSNAWRNPGDGYYRVLMERDMNAHQNILRGHWLEL